MRSKRQSGVALVEFALVLPVLIILGMLTAEFGRALYQYDLITKSVRDAARWATTQTPDIATTRTGVRNIVMYGNTAGTGTLLVPGLTATNVPDAVWQTAGTDPVINTVTVRVTGYTFDSMLSSMFGIALPALTFSNITATMRSPL
jgi:Flp pilus assembly protein TadG